MLRFSHRLVTSVIPSPDHDETKPRRSAFERLIHQLLHFPLLPTALFTLVLLAINLTLFLMHSHTATILTTASIDTNHWSAPSQLDSLYPSSAYDRPIASYALPVTVTSAFFPANDSKHTLEEYSVWLSAFLATNKVPMVIFTSPEYYPVLASLRYRSLFVESTMADFTLQTVNNIGAVQREIAAGRSLLDMRTHWMIEYSSPLDIPPLEPMKQALQTSQRDLDPESARHTAHLYAVWNAKPFMLAWTAKQNPFHSKYFFWMDAGQMRDPMNDHYVDWPNIDQVANTFGEVPNMPIKPYVAADHPHPSRAPRIHSRQHKMLNVIINVFPSFLCKSLGNMDVNHITNVTLTRYNLVEGTNYGGTMQAVTWYEQLYYETMTTWEKQNIFVGKDQNIQNAILTAYPSSFLLLGAHNVGPTRHLCGTEWFFFAQYLCHFRDRAPGCPDENYDHRWMVREGQTICDQPADKKWIQDY